MLVNFHVLMGRLVVCVAHTLPKVELIFVEEVIEFANKPLIFFLLLLFFVDFGESADTFAATHPEAVLACVELPTVVEDRESR